MDIGITARGFHLEEDVKEYVHGRMEKLERHYNPIFKCDVILYTERERKIAEVILHLKKARVVAKGSSTDMFASIDRSADSLKKQLRRLSGRLSSRRRRTVLDIITSPIGSLRRASRRSAEVQIVKANFFADKPMVPEEARLELELMKGRIFLMFKNADTGESNVIYKRDDGKYGHIEPDF